MLLPLFFVVPMRSDNQTSADINVVQEFSEHFREHLLSVQHQQMEERSTLERMKVQVFPYSV
mgnify:CR=1 FL=1